MDVTTPKLVRTARVGRLFGDASKFYIFPGLKSWAGLSKSRRVAFMNLQTRSSLRALQVFVP